MESKKDQPVFTQTDSAPNYLYRNDEPDSSQLNNAPVVGVDATGAFRHIISFKGAVMLNGRTRCGFACEIWAMLGEQTDFTYLSTETHSPCTVSYSESAKNKTVVYRLRWINKQGGKSPWSEILKIVIT